MTRSEFKAELVDLILELLANRPANRQSDDELQLTIGVDAKDWSYQTGDTSFVGGAYGYANWGIVYLYTDTVPEEAAETLLEDLESTAEEDTVFFYDQQEKP